MSMVSSYILSIAGIVILGVLITVIMPDGQMGKYVNNIFALIVVFVIVSPIPSILNYDMDTSAILTGAGIEIDQNFIYLVNSQTLAQLEGAIEYLLKDANILGVDVIISANIFTSPFIVQKVTVDLQNLVINPSNQHINIYSKIKEIILNNIDVEEENIVFYGAT
jgi:hypothetical protein